MPRGTRVLTRTGVQHAGSGDDGAVEDEDGLIITEVPAHLRDQWAPPPPLRRDPTEQHLEPALDAALDAALDVASADDGGPTERTRVRADTAYAGGALRQPTGATVPAVWCPAGHFSPPDAPYCRCCGEPVPPQQPIRVPRPPLGTLHLPEGQRVLLDRPAVLGRRPVPLPDGDPWPHLVELPPDLTHLSRNHVAVELDGWHVLARDLGSSGGTALHAPGRPPIRLRPHDPHVLEPGQSLMLSGDFAVAFVVATT